MKLHAVTTAMLAGASLHTAALDTINGHTGLHTAANLAAALFWALIAYTSPTPTSPIRRLHQPHNCDDSASCVRHTTNSSCARADRCDHCGRRYPCPTARLAGAHQ